MKTFWVWTYHQADGLRAVGFPTKRLAVDRRYRAGCRVGQIVKVSLPVELEATVPYRKWVNGIRKANGKAPGCDVVSEGFCFMCAPPDHARAVAMRAAWCAKQRPKAWPIKWNVFEREIARSCRVFQTHLDLELQSEGSGVLQ